jgi:hypothetical protein
MFFIPPPFVAQKTTQCKSIYATVYLLVSSHITSVLHELLIN